MGNEQIKLISKYRTQLMGLAMLFVVVFHSSFEMNTYMKSVKDLGDVGVDIFLFLFLSGVGLYFSYSSNDNKKIFYKKRIHRILPTYMPVAFIWQLALNMVFGGTLLDLFLVTTAFAFWYDGRITAWYVSGILLLYFITPFYLDKMKKRPKLITYISCALFIATGLSIRFCLSVDILNKWLVFLCRIPIFLIGLYFGYLIKERYEIKNFKWIYTLSLFAIIICIMITTPGGIYIPFIFKYYAFIPLSISICLFVAQMFNNSKTQKFRFLTFLGTFSFEIYLLHDKILWLLSVSEKIIVIDKYNIFINALAIIITLISAYIWSNIVSKSIEKYQLLRHPS